MRIYYSPRDARRYVSALDVLDGKVDPQGLKDKLVLVGMTGLALTDYQNTPLGEAMPGSEIHAQLLENLFDQTWLHATGLGADVRARGIRAARLAADLGHAALEAAQCRAARHGVRRAAGAGGVISCFVPAAPTVRRGDPRPGAADPVQRAAGADARRRRPAQEVARARRAGAARSGGVHLRRTRGRAAHPDRHPATAGVAARRAAHRPGGDDDCRRTKSAATSTTSSCWMPIACSSWSAMSQAKDCRRASSWRSASRCTRARRCMRPDASVGELMRAANAEISRDNPEMYFVTAFAGILDLVSGELSYCNAGHDNPYVLAAPQPASRAWTGRRTAAVHGRRLRLCCRQPSHATRRIALRGDRRRGRRAEPGRRTLRQRTLAQLCSRSCGRRGLTARAVVDAIGADVRDVRRQRRTRRRRHGAGAAMGGPGNRVLAVRAIARIASAHDDLDAAIARLGHAVGRRHGGLALAARQSHGCRRARMPSRINAARTISARCWPSASLA